MNPNQRSIETHLQCVVLWKTIFLGLRFASPQALNDAQLRCSKDCTLADSFHESESIASYLIPAFLERRSRDSSKPGAKRKRSQVTFHRKPAR